MRLSRAVTALYIATHSLALLTAGSALALATYYRRLPTLALATLLLAIVIYYEVRLGIMADPAALAMRRARWYSTLIEVTYHIGVLALALAIYLTLGVGVWVAITAILQVITWLFWLAAAEPTPRNETWLKP